MCLYAFPCVYVGVLFHGHVCGRFWYLQVCQLETTDCLSQAPAGVCKMGTAAVAWEAARISSTTMWVGEWSGVETQGALDGHTAWSILFLTTCLGIGEPGCCTASSVLIKGYFCRWVQMSSLQRVLSASGMGDLNSPQSPACCCLFVRSINGSLSKLLCLKNLSQCPIERTSKTF